MDIPEYNGTTDAADAGWDSTGVHDLNIFYDVSLIFVSLSPSLAH